MSQTTPAVLRAGIIGTGFMGGVHATAVRAAGHMISRVAGSTPAAGAVAAGEERDGVPTFADGHRAAVLTAAVIDSAKINSWVEVPV